MNSMKNVKKKLLLLPLLFGFFLVGCSGKPENQNQESTTATINVKTAVCGSCSKTIKKALQAVHGVQEVEVDLEAHTAKVVFMPAKVDLKTLELAVANAGYNANETPRNQEAYEKLDACCKTDESSHPN